MKLASFNIYGTFDQMISKENERFLIDYYSQKEPLCQKHEPKVLSYF